MSVTTEKPHRYKGAVFLELIKDCRLPNVQTQGILYSFPYAFIIHRAREYQYIDKFSNYFVSLLWIKNK